MKKIIFLSLISIVSSINIFAMCKAEMPDKIRELFYNEFPKLKTPVSLTAEILIRYISKTQPIHPKKFTIS